MQNNNKKLKKMPEDAIQHSTAGPYSPILEINCNKLIVISGQAAIDLDGNVIGETIEQQAEYTLKNCLAQLERTKCDFDDVFKVNIYMKNLDDWHNFNRVYKNYFPDPKPVRTAVGVQLLPKLLVEIELWAIK